MKSSTKSTNLDQLAEKTWALESVASDKNDYTKGFRAGFQAALESEEVKQIVRRGLHLRHLILCMDMLAPDNSPGKVAAKEFDEALASFSKLKGGGG